MELKAGQTFTALSEDIFRSWLRGDLALQSDLSKRLNLEFLPEPYLLFGGQERPLYVLTTNPGEGQDFQHRAAIRTGRSLVSATSSYAEIAQQLGPYYRVYLRSKGNLQPASRRIERIVELALRSGYSGVMQIEAVPFHSADLPGKDALASWIARCPLSSRYVAALKDFLREKAVFAVSGISSRVDLAQTQALNEWHRFIGDLMGLDFRRTTVHPVTTKEGKATSVALMAEGQSATKMLYLVQGNNNMPDADGVALVVQLMRGAERHDPPSAEKRDRQLSRSNVQLKTFSRTTDFGLSSKLALLQERAEDVKGAFDALDQHARILGDDVEVWHAENGPGREFRRNGRLFFRMDPKPTRKHIQVRVLGIPKEELELAGPVSSRQERGWIVLTNTRNVDVLADLVCRAYASAATS